MTPEPFPETGGTAAPSRIAHLLEQVRRGLDRVPPHALADELAAGALVVDTRPLEQRQRDGELPGAVVIGRNVLEWRLDPTSPDRRRDLDLSDERRIVVVCDEGYSSSLMAANLRLLGLRNATDLIDGFQGLLRLDAGSSSTDAPAALG